MENNQKNIKGFTLIELLISTTLIVLIMLSVSSLFMTFLIGGSKTNVKKKLSEEGAFALSQMEFLLKNARHIDELTCSSGMNSIRLISIDNGQTTLRRITTGGIGKVASNSAYLTSDAVDVPLGGLLFNCSGEAGNRQVEIYLTLDKTSPDGNQTETFHSIVNVRN